MRAKPCSGATRRAAHEVTQGTVVAHIIGPKEPAPDSTLPKLNGVFWVTLRVVDVRDNFAVELKGKTIKLPTEPFSKTLLGQTLPIALTHSPGALPGFGLLVDLYECGDCTS